MKAIIVESRDSSNLKLLLELARKLNIKTQILSIEEQEDFAMANAILKEESGEYISNEELQKRLSE